MLLKVVRIAASVVSCDQTAANRMLSASAGLGQGKSLKDHSQNGRRLNGSGVSDGEAVDPGTDHA